MKSLWKYFKQKIKMLHDYDFFFSPAFHCGAEMLVHSVSPVLTCALMIYLEDALNFLESYFEVRISSVRQK